MNWENIKQENLGGYGALNGANAALHMMGSHQGGGAQVPSHHMQMSMQMSNLAQDEDSIDAGDEDDECANDAEGVWSPDIEACFQEALDIYPPCGRRKIILSDEGKMYGRNELIARYIKVRTGKTRTRKQVSSHIQVLAKRKTKDFCPTTPQKSEPNFGPRFTSPSILATNNSFLNQARPQFQAPMHHQYQQANGYGSQAAPPTAIWSHPGIKPEMYLAAAALNVAQQRQVEAPSIVSPALSPNPNGNASAMITSSSSSSSSSSSCASASSASASSSSIVAAANANQAFWSVANVNKCIGSSKLRLIEFSGFLEQRRDPDIYQKHLFVHLNPSESTQDEFECINMKEFVDKFPEDDLVADKRVSYLVKFWVDLNYNVQDSINALYAVNNIFESPDPLNISCSTKVCSFGNQVVEKKESENFRMENGRYVYRIENSPMCEYMITFINKLKSLPEQQLKNSVLENFSVLQLIRDSDTQELLLSLAYVFEVSTSEHGAQHVIYRMTK